MMLCRLPGWEGRLAQVIEAAAGRPYRLGEHDCFRFACQAVEALAGVDLWAEWRGRYSTQLGALRLLREYGGGFSESFTKLFCVDPSPALLARRGDIMEFRELASETGPLEPHLGVCNGARVAVLLERGGLGFVELIRCAHAWRIG